VTPAARNGRAGAVEVGVLAPTYAATRGTIGAALEAEAGDADAVWYLSPRLAASLSSGGPDAPCWAIGTPDRDPLALASAILLAARRVRVGILGIDLVDPAPGRLAVVAATLADLAPGRVVLGLGGRSVTAEALGALDAALGPLVQQAAARPELLVMGAGADAAERAALHGASWLAPSWVTPATISAVARWAGGLGAGVHLLAVIHDDAALVRRAVAHKVVERHVDARAGWYASSTAPNGGPGAGAVACGTPSEVAEVAAGYAEAGATRLVIENLLGAALVDEAAVGARALAKTVRITRLLLRRRGAPTVGGPT
jgi:alkanesulfonate monooxygenase SsuD/methylene tetrahydromethanopterin reductase-like flavin-dependent oxidoreductase (luciferase family)